MIKHCNLVLEVGPGRILSKIVKKIAQVSSNHSFDSLPVESSVYGGSWRPFYDTIAQLYILNTPFTHRILFANRLVRPLRSANDMSFIVSLHL